MVFLSLQVSINPTHKNTLSLRSQSSRLGLILSLQTRSILRGCYEWCIACFSEVVKRASHEAYFILHALSTRCFQGWRATIVHKNELILTLVTFACCCLVHIIYLVAISRSILKTLMRMLHPSWSSWICWQEKISKVYFGILSKLFPKRPMLQ